MNNRGNSRVSRSGKMIAMLRGGVSISTLCMLGMAVPALAQTANPPAEAPADQADAPKMSSEDIVVTGIRASLANAQKIKRESDTIVDAITAQDIGALPDRSVTEALQRVPGVSINRFAGSNDPDHFSVEGSGVVIRGLNFVRSEFNGRDSFSAGVGGQSLNFADVPAELLGSVEVYKNSTADMIEGGLAGTVNLNTRKPFDSRDTKFHFSFDAEANYGDFEKKWSPTGSILVSKNFDTGFGRIGLLGDVSYSRIRSRADGLQITNYQTRDGATVSGANGGGNACRTQLPSSTDTTRLPAGGAACGTASTAGADGFADLLPKVYAPLGGQFRSQDFDRKRDGVALAAQFETIDRSALFTAQFLRSHTSNAWGEHTFETAPDLSEYNTFPAGCQQNGNSPTGGTRAECPIGSLKNYTYDDSGLFQKGYITLPGTGWRTAGSGNGNSNFVPSGGQQQSLSRRQVYETNTNTDYGLNAQLHPTDRLLVNLDFDYTESRHTNLDVSTFGSTFADQELDLTGSLPIITPHKPLTLAASWATPNSALVNATDAQYFANPNVQFWRAAMDHIEDSTGHEVAVRADLAYKFEDGSFLNKIKFGARYADRDQTVRYTTYNWGAISEVWSGAPVSIQQGGVSNVDYYTYPNFFRGQTNGPPGGYYYNGDLIGDYNKASTYLQSLNDIWRNTNGATASNRWSPAAGRAGVIAGTPYLPSEIQPVNQQDKNIYVMAAFGSKKFSGNIGVRYVATDVTSMGSVGVPTAQQAGVDSPYATRCAVRTDPANPGQTLPPTGICKLSATQYGALQTFADGSTFLDIARNHYGYFLPSANIKFNATNNLVFRLAGSKVLTRPDSSYIRNFLQTGFDNSSLLLTAQTGNPYLKPATAWQFDATAEWYFSRVGSLTMNIFYKDVKNFFYQAVTNRAVTNNGVTQLVSVRGPANYSGSGKIKGFELAYQQTFDFLPGLLSGFGFNGNYSYIESKGLPNSFLNGGNLANSSTVAPGSLPLEGLSKHNANATIFYEKGPVSLRAAYNWRSRFLLTAADVIFPYYSIFNEPTGQLDASAFININKQFKIGVQGVNLTNTVTKTTQAYTSDPGVLAPRSYFMNDRRFSFILRGTF